MQFMASEQESSSSDDENSEMLSDDFSLQDSEDEPDLLTADAKMNKTNTLSNGHQVLPNYDEI